jgi:hypothetical protein
LAAWSSLSLLLAVAWPSQLLANPAIANNPPCNSSKMMFRPTGSNPARAIAFVKSRPGAGQIVNNNDGTYTVAFASAKQVNALIDDLNKNHAAEVIDLFQFFQCKYGF